MIRIQIETFLSFSFLLSFNIIIPEVFISFTRSVKVSVYKGIFSFFFTCSFVYTGIEQVMRIELYLIVLLQIEFVWSIRCYSCVGKIGKKQKTLDPCINPAENVGDGNVEEIECLNSKLCWKAITGGQLKRGCGEKRCAFIPDINMGSLISQTCCSNDLCNQTSSINFSKISLFFLISLVYFIR